MSQAVSETYIVSNTLLHLYLCVTLAAAEERRPGAKLLLHPWAERPVPQPRLRPQPRRLSQTREPEHAAQGKRSTGATAGSDSAVLSRWCCVSSESPHSHVTVFSSPSICDLSDSCTIDCLLCWGPLSCSHSSVFIYISLLLLHDDTTPTQLNVECGKLNRRAYSHSSICTALVKLPFSNSWANVTSHLCLM